MGRTSVSVIMPTFNRAASLDRTLSAMASLDTPAADVSFLVVNNASTDETREVLSRHADHLNLIVVDEATPGKCYALNTAIARPELGDIVVFTDDDILPRHDWLVEIVAACDRYPDVTIFGGKIEIEWPNIDVPKWAFDEKHAKWAFSKVDWGEEERLWPEKTYPFGPNYWVRKSVFENGLQFDTYLGPKAGGTILGDESKFLQELRAAGHTIMYIPTSSVKHCINEETLTESGITRRALGNGRRGPHLEDWKHVDLLRRHPMVYRLLRTASVGYYRIRFWMSHLIRDSDKRIDRKIRFMKRIGSNQEFIKLYRSKLRELGE